MASAAWASAGGSVFLALSGWTPRLLPAGSAWFDFDELMRKGQIWQDRAGTQVCTSAGQTVGRFADLLPFGMTMTAPSDAARGVLRQAGGGVFYLEMALTGNYYRNDVSNKGNAIFRNKPGCMLFGAGNLFDNGHIGTVYTNTGKSLCSVGNRQFAATRVSGDSTTIMNRTPADILRTTTGAIDSVGGFSYFLSNKNMDQSLSLPSSGNTEDLQHAVGSRIGVSNGLGRDNYATAFIPFFDLSIAAKLHRYYAGRLGIA